LDRGVGLVLSELLTVTETAPGTFTGPVIGPAGKRAYGGLIYTQALLAAARTVPPGQEARNLHVHFLRGSDAGDPFTFTVEETRTGRTASARRVRVEQSGLPVATITAGFALPAPGIEHNAAQPVAEDPDALAATGPAGPSPAFTADVVEIRFCDHGAGTGFVRHLWWRCPQELPDDPQLHTAIGAFVADNYLLEAPLRVHGLTARDRAVKWATTQHSTWFHRPVRADAWNLIESRSPVAAGGRGIVTASCLDRAGAITATIVQEVLLEERA
jgi:acyl-CoA thioesterase II